MSLNFCFVNEVWEDNGAWAEKAHAVSRPSFLAVIFTYNILTGPWVKKFQKTDNGGSPVRLSKYRRSVPYLWLNKWKHRQSQKATLCLLSDKRQWWSEKYSRLIIFLIIRITSSINEPLTLKMMTQRKGERKSKPYFAYIKKRNENSRISFMQLF